MFGSLRLLSGDDSERPLSQRTMMRAFIVAAMAVAGADAFAPRLALPTRGGLPARSSLRLKMQSIWTPYDVKSSRSHALSNGKSNNIRMMPEPPKPDQSPQKPSIPMPMVSVGEGQMDIYSRLAKDRILLLGTDVNDEMANNLVAQMLFLANEDPGKDITMYINSPGGSVSAGMAIYDTMQYIPCDVSTVCFGTAASMGAFLLCSGAAGKRKSLPNSRIMIHQPLGGAQGQAADIEIQAREILFVKSLLNSYMADATGQPLDKIEEDTDRDFFMTPEEAMEYGIIDEVIQTKKSNLPKPKRPELI